jgi:hypothetical protein
MDYTDNVSPSLTTTQVIPQTYHYKHLPKPALKPFRISYKEALAGIFDESCRGLHGFGLLIEVPVVRVHKCLSCNRLVALVAIGNGSPAVYDAIADTVPAALLNGRPAFTVYFCKLAFFHECLFAQAVEVERFLHSRQRVHDLLKPEKPPKARVQ